MKVKVRALLTITNELHAAFKYEIGNIIKIGALLIEAKEQLNHGDFLPWLKREFDRLSERSARNYMSAARFADKWAKSATVADLKLTPLALYELGGLDDDDDTDFTPEVITAIFNEAYDKWVDVERCYEIADSLAAKPQDDEAEEGKGDDQDESVGDEEGAEESADDDSSTEDPDKAAEGILDGPNPILPPSDSPSSTPPEQPSSPDEHVTAFENAIKTLKPLRTKTVKKFRHVVPDDDVRRMAEFLNAVIDCRPTNDIQTATIKKLSKENDDLKAQIAELEQSPAPETSAPADNELRIRNIGLQSENEELHARIKELQARIDVLEKLPADGSIPAALDRRPVT